jgi:hypothetical protein
MDATTTVFLVVGAGGGGDDPAGFNTYNNSQMAGVCPVNFFLLLEA